MRVCVGTDQNHKVMNIPTSFPGSLFSASLGVPKGDREGILPFEYNFFKMRDLSKIGENHLDIPQLSISSQME